MLLSVGAAHGYLIQPLRGYDSFGKATKAVYLLYSALLTFGFILMAPWFALDALRTRKHITGLSQRLGYLPQLPPSKDPLIWLHCVSVGETEAARPLVRALREQFPAHRLVVSTTTVTGQHIAQRTFTECAAAVFYFPIDWSWVIRRVLRRLRPSAVLIMETELWPNLLRECRRRTIPVAVVNGRISTKSFGRYQLIRPFMRRVLNDLSLAVMQSDADAHRIKELGLKTDRVSVSGNLKFDSADAALADASTVSTIRDRFNFNRAVPLIVAASTHAPEESFVIEAFRKIGQSANARLLIAPRHPERFEEVHDLIQASKLTWARRSAAPKQSDSTCDVVLLDSLGELRAVFALADIAFIGGSIIPHGGHNVLEPAAQGVCVITGAHTDNFAAIMQTFLAEGALVQLPRVSPAEAGEQLATVLNELLENSARRRDIGQQARTVWERNRGATERAVNMVSQLLASSQTANDTIPFPAAHLTAAK